MEENMVETLATFIEIAGAFAIIVLFSNFLKGDQHHDDGKLKPIRVPATYRRTRRNRR
jgi:hypothetical protein